MESSQIALVLRVQFHTAPSSYHCRGRALGVRYCGTRLSSRNVVQEAFSRLWYPTSCRLPSDSLYRISQWVTSENTCSRSSCVVFRGAPRSRFGFTSSDFRQSFLGAYPASCKIYRSQVHPVLECPIPRVDIDEVRWTMAFSYQARRRRRCETGTNFV